MLLNRGETAFWAQASCLRIMCIATAMLGDSGQFSLDLHVGLQ